LYTLVSGLPVVSQESVLPAKRRRAALESGATDASSSLLFASAERQRGLRARPLYE
jgi:hypothetical protein